MMMPNSYFASVIISPFHVLIMTVIDSGWGSAFLILPWCNDTSYQSLVMQSLLFPKAHCRRWILQMQITMQIFWKPNWNERNMNVCENWCFLILGALFLIYLWNITCSIKWIQKLSENLYQLTVGWLGSKEMFLWIHILHLIEMEIFFYHSYWRSQQ